MAVAKRVIRWVVFGILSLILLAVGSVAVLTRTPWGVERAGQFIVGRIESSINGTLTVERVTANGSLLRGVTLHGVVLTDPDDRPFVRADSARLNYNLRTLLGGSVVFDGLTLYGPDVIIERLPGQTDWNYDRIFADTSAVDTTASPAPADTATPLVLIRDAGIVNGRVRVRSPWEPGPEADTARMVLETVPGGQVRTLWFDSVDARLPEVVWSSPDVVGQRFQVDHLAARAYIWRTPVDVQDLEGRVTIQDSVIGFQAEPVRLPDSEVYGNGQVVVGRDGSRYTIEAVATKAAFRDFRWLYPRLPVQGGGSLRFRMETRPSGRLLLLARDAKLATQGSEIAGSFGVVTGDTLRFTDVDLTVQPLDLEVLAAMLPDGFPLSGLVMGELTAEGTPDALQTAGDVRYRTFDADGNGAESDVRWNGTVGLGAPYRLRGLEVELRSVELAQIAQWVPDLRLRGVARGTLRATGTLRGGTQVSGGLSLTHGDQRSSIQGSGRFALGDTPTFDLQFDAQPVALELLAEQAPGLQGLRGEARGPVTVSGSLDDLTVGADISTPAGDVVVRGSLALNGTPRYQAQGSVTDFRVDRVVANLPETVVTSRFDLEGTGLKPEEVDGRVNLDVLSASVDGVDVYRAVLHGRLERGLARVDSLMVRTEVGDAVARGSFGLLEDQTGDLQVSVNADSLVFLEPVFFSDAQPLDIGFQQAARIDGRVNVEGRISGNVADWETSGTARIRSFVYDQLQIGRGRIDGTWKPDSLELQLQVDSLRHGDRRLAGVQGTARYVGGRGHVALDVRGRQSQALTVESTFEPQGDVLGLGLEQLRLVGRDGEWALADTAHATVGANGFQVDSLVLVRAPRTGRIRVAGVLPWRQPEADEVQEASLAVDIDSVRIGEFLRVTQTDTLVDGTVTGKVRVRGTALEPDIQARVDIQRFRYAGATLDSVQVEVAYDNRDLNGDFAGWQDRVSILTGRLQIPLELALTDREDRLVDRPMDVRINADRVPAELLSFLTPGFRNLDGTVRGELAFVGTPLDPDLQGSLALTQGSAFFEPLNVAYRNVEITSRMMEGSEIQLEANLRTASGRARIQGTLDLAEPSDPVFDLQVNASRLDATRRRDVTAVVDGVAQLRGRYSRPVVTGDLSVVRGEMNLDELWRQSQIVQLDTTLFQMLDTTQVSYRPTPDNPFLENLRVTNATLRMDRNFWLRSQELNMEVGGNLAVEVDRQNNDLRMTGTLQVIQGTYQLVLGRALRGLPLERRFDIRNGTIEFVGTPGINPNLSIEAAYRVRPAQGEPINVIASVAGTLQDPRVSLTSDADVQLSETDLASYILFGRAGAELTQAQLDAVTASALGAVSPAVTGLASNLTQQWASNLGLPVDYISFSLPGYDPSQQGWLGGLWQNTQIEVGFDPAQNVSVIGSVRLPGSGVDEGASALRLFGARVQYRPWQTWTIEGYIEDQFARRPSFGTAEISDRKVLGLSFFREWGY